MLKRKWSLVVMVLMLFSLLAAAALPTAAARSISIKSDFAGYTDGDVGPLSLAKIFKLESADHARIKYSFGKGYLCPDGGGATASIVYKIELQEGETLSALDMTVKAHFASRAEYNPEWTQSPKGVVSVSSDGTAYTDVATFEGEMLDKSLGQNDFSTLTPKTYTADLKDAAGSASTIYVKLSWAVYDYPMYSSVHSVEFSGSTAGGTGEPEPPESEPTPPQSEPEPTDPDVSQPDASQLESSAPDTSKVTTTRPTTTVPADDADNGDGGGVPVAVIVVIVVVLLLAAAGGIVFLLYKKGIFKKNP